MAKLEEKLFGVTERNAQLEEENARLHEQVARLEQQLAAAHKDSSTSSKPPSSDIVKPKKPLPKGGKKRKKGGQPGHEQHLRSPFPPGRSIISSPTPSTVARTAAAGWSFRGASRKCSSRWKSPKRRPW